MKTITSKVQLILLISLILPFSCIILMFTRFDFLIIPLIILALVSIYYINKSIKRTQTDKIDYAKYLTGTTLVEMEEKGYLTTISKERLSIQLENIFKTERIIIDGSRSKVEIGEPIFISIRIF